MKQRIYLVKGKHDAHLVRAPSRFSAVNYVASKSYTVELAEQDTLVEMLGRKHVVEDARWEQEDLPLEQEGMELGS